MPDPGLNSPLALARFLGANASSRRLRHRQLQEEGDFFQSPVLVAGPLLPSPPSSSPGPAPSWGRSWPLAELQPPPPLRGALRGQRKYEFRAWLPCTFGAQSAHVLMKPTRWGQVASTSTHTHTGWGGRRLQPRSRVARVICEDPQGPTALGIRLICAHGTPAHLLPQPDSAFPYFMRNLTVSPLSLGPNRGALHFAREPALLLLRLRLSLALSGSTLQSLCRLSLPRAPIG